MQGASRTALTAARERLAERAGEPGFAALSEELLDVAGLLARESQLRSALTDPSDSPERRADLASGLLRGQVSPLAVDVVAGLVASRWSAPRELVDATEALAAEAAFVTAEQQGRLDTVEDELFRFARAVDGSPELRSTLTDPAVPDQDKAAVVGDLLQGKACDETYRLVRYVAAHPRGRRIEEAVSTLVQAASVRRQHLVAEVRVAAALSPSQHDRLAAVLGRVYGRRVHLQVTIDPAVLGGVDVRVGDERIDGTVAHRLAEARQTFGT
jgi:F-type H+-transporting ATPase subunit delta